MNQLIKMTYLIIRGCSKFFAACLLLVAFFAHAKAQPAAISDKIFSLTDMQEIVLQHHPIVKQASLLSKGAKARVLQALGNFDPSIMASFGRKSFGGTDYYNHWESNLKIPLWVAGADLNVGYDRNVGVYNNPETRTSNTGLSALGLSIPLAQGLLIDSRRNTLRQAKLMVGYAEADQILQINGVWFGAVKDYWNWYAATLQNGYLQKGVALAEKRFKALREQVLLGDKPPIDSVEASITFQDRSVQLQEAEVKMNNARIILSNHLWNDQNIPVELPADALPEEIANPIARINLKQIDSLMVNVSQNHPEMLKLKNRNQQLQVEEQYRADLLKPKLNVKGNFLAARRDFSYVDDGYDFHFANYKIGLDFSFPLFLREERGKLREVKIQRQQLSYGIQQTGRELQTGMMAAYNEIKAYQNQFQLQSRNLINQQVLVNGEIQKFELGESNLFLINTRESKLIDMQLRETEIRSGLLKALAELYYRSGRSILP